MAMGAECDDHHSVTTTLHYLETSTGSNLPQATGRIFTGACKHAPVWMKRHRSDPTAMPLQRHQTIPRTCIPYTHRLISTPRSKQVPLGIVGDRPHPVMMTRERLEATSGSNIPEANGRIIAAAG